MGPSASIEVRLLGPDDESVLRHVAADVFDEPVDPVLAREFVIDPRHHLAVALDGELVVGIASAVHYVHPDKPAQLFVNEVGVAPTHQRRGIGRRLMEALFSHARALGCIEAWVGTESDNVAARGLYEAAGGGDESEAFVMYTFPLRDEGGDE